MGVFIATCLHGTARADGWELFEKTDPIHGTSWDYAELKPVSGASLLLALECNDGRPVVWLANENNRFRRVNNEGDFGIVLVEMRINDNHSMTVAFTEAQTPGLIYSPSQIEALVMAMNFMFTPKSEQPAVVHDFSKYMALFAMSSKMLIRVYDIRGNPYLAEFAPSQGIEGAMRHLPCI
ncbi:hypothetical protein [Pontibaca methylaminivorans]|uniref:hypothetical protein n=1 Tax=Pontibaca methylaminivorans TaxID=515897 RepID=UPI002FDA8B01